MSPRETIVRTDFEAGFLITTDESGNKRQLPLKEMLRSADIPKGVDHTQIQQLTSLANMFIVLIRTLIDRQVLGESFLEKGELDLDDVVQAMVDIGGDFYAPDIFTPVDTVT